MKSAFGFSSAKVSLIGVALASLLGSGMSAAAADITYDFPAGQACRDFAVRLEVFFNFTGQDKVFHDKNGNTVRWLAAGKGNDIVFTNLDTGFTLPVQGKGFKYSFAPNPDGSTSFESTGHQVLILSPADTPAGPSSTLYVGRLVFTVDANDEVYVLSSFTGRSSDVCAALSR